MFYTLLFLILTFNISSFYAMMQPTNQQSRNDIYRPAYDLSSLANPLSFANNALKNGRDFFFKNEHADAAQQLTAGLTTAETYNLNNIFAQNQLYEIYNMLSYSYYSIANPNLAQPWITKILESNNQKCIESVFKNLSTIKNDILKFPEDKQEDIIKNVRSNRQCIKKNHPLSCTIQQSLALSYAQGSNGYEKSLKKSLYFFNHFLCNLLDPKQTKSLPITRFRLYQAINTISDDANEKELAVIWEYRNFLEKYCAYSCTDAASINNTLNINTDNPVRKLIFKLIAHHKDDEQNTIIESMQALEAKQNFATTMESFIATDTSIAKTILKYMLKNNLRNNQSTHYLLGLLYHHEGKYDHAIEHFNASKYDTKAHRVTDLFTDYKVLVLHITQNKTINTAHATTLLDTLSSSKTDSTSMVCAWNGLRNNHLNYFTLLMNQNQYQLAFRLANYFINDENTRIFIINFINDSSRCAEQYVELMQLFFSSEVYQSIKSFTHIINKDSALATARLLTAELRLTPDGQQKDKLTSLILKHIKAVPINDPDNKSALAKIYNTLGISLNNENFLQTALELGLQEAQLNKALFMLNNTGNASERREQKALGLLHNYAKENNEQTLRAHAFTLLGEYYFEYEARTSLLSHVSTNNETALQYLIQAKKLDDKDAIGLLGILHLKGVQKNGKVILKQNIDKGRKYLGQQPASSNTPALPEILLFYAADLYKQSNFKECSRVSILGMHHENCSPCAKLSMGLYCNLARIKSASDISLTKEPMRYLYKIRQKPLANKKNSDIFFQFIDDEVQTIFDNETKRIINATDTSDDALNYCLHVGTIYCSSDYTHPLFARGFTCLKYVAEHARNKIQRKAQYALAQSCQHLIPLYLCIDYLQNSLRHAQDNLNYRPLKVKKLQEELADRYPKDIAQQFLLLESYQLHNQHDRAQEYLTKLFSGTTIIIENLSQQTTDPLVERCGKNELLINSTREFAKNTNAAHEDTDASIAQENAAAMVACIYAYSQTPKLLIQSMCYLSLLEKKKRFKNRTPAVIRLVNSQLGTAYHNNNSHKLAMQCFQKAANCGDPKAIKYVALEYLNNNPHVTMKPVELMPLLRKALNDLPKDSPDAKKLSGYLAVIRKILDKPQNKTVITNLEEALQSEGFIKHGIYLDSYHLTAGNQQHTKDQGVNAPKTKNARTQQTPVKPAPVPKEFTELLQACVQQENKVTSILNACVIKEKADKHPLQGSLINQKMSSYAKNEQYLKILTNHISNKTPNITHLKQLADSSQPHPHACVLLATVNVNDYLTKKNPHFYQLFEYYLQLSFELGIIKKNGHDSVFIDGAYLDVLLNIIVKLTQDNEQKELSSRMIKFITTILPMHNINMENFTQFCKDIQKVDLPTINETKCEAKECENKIASQSKASAPTPQETTSKANNVKSLLDAREIQKKLHEHELFPLIAHEKFSHLFSDKHYSNILYAIANSSLDISSLQELANQLPPHPHARILLATVYAGDYYVTKNCHSYGSFKDYFTSGFKAGIIKKNGCYSKFIDGECLNLVLSIFNNLTENDKYKEISREIIKFIKRTLTEHDINMKHVTQFCKDIYNVNLDNY